jgi:hypothetical protein
LSPDRALSGSTLQSDYPDSIFIRARHAENIAITGSGTIDGRGIEFLGKEGPYIFEKKDWRPRLILLEDCRHVRVSDVNLREAAFWSLHLAGCEDVSIHGISIRNNLKAPNCDGIDPDHSRNVRITDCSVECGDDAIVIKTSREFSKYGPCENIVVSGCVLTTHDCALKIGSETVDADPQHRVRRLRRQPVQPGDRDNAAGRGQRGEHRGPRHRHPLPALLTMTWWGASEAIYVDAHPQGPRGKARAAARLRFSHIISHAEAGVFIEGSPECTPEDIVLDDVTLNIAKTTEWPSRIDLRPPEELGIEEKGVVIAGIHLQDARTSPCGTAPSDGVRTRPRPTVPPWRSCVSRPQDREFPGFRRPRSVHAAPLHAGFASIRRPDPAGLNGSLPAGAACGAARPARVAGADPDLATLGPLVVARQRGGQAEPRDACWRSTGTRASAASRSAQSTAPRATRTSFIDLSFASVDGHARGDNAQPQAAWTSAST